MGSEKIKDATNQVDFNHPCAGHVKILDRESGVVESFCPDGTKRTKLALVGFAASSKDLAPFDDPTWEIVGLNQLYRHIPRADRWIEIHANWNEHVVEGTDHHKWLAEAPIPIYMAERVPSIPNSVKFPLDRIMKQGGHPDYFTSTVAFVIALAIEEGFKEIGLWGIDLIVGDEYCVAPETKILTADLRWVQAGKLNAGDRLVAFDEEPTGKMSDGRASARFWRETELQVKQELTRPCYRVTLDDGTIFVSSAEHRWLTKCGSGYRWRETKDLITPSHRRPSRLVRLLDTWEQDSSREAGYLAGAFDGEGCLIQQPRLSGDASVVKLGFAQRDNAMSKYVDRCLDGLGFQSSKKKLVSSKLSKSACYQIDVLGGRPEIMRFLGQVRPERLIEKFNPGQLGRLHDLARPAVVKCEYIGEQPVIGLKTGTGTIIAEGLASHNSYQKPCAEFWLGVAHGKGITITLPNTTALCKQSHRYGYQQEPESLVKMSEISKRRQALLDERHKKMIELANIDGAVQESQMWGDLADLRMKGGTVNP